MSRYTLDAAGQQKLSRALKGRGVHADQIAEHIGKHVTTIYRLLNGKTSTGRADWAGIASMAGMVPDDLLPHLKSASHAPMPTEAPPPASEGRLFINKLGNGQSIVSVVVPDGVAEKVGQSLSRVLT